MKFDIENGVLKKYNGCGGAVTIPDSVSSIGKAAFRGCWGLADQNGSVIVRGIVYDRKCDENIKSHATARHGVQVFGMFDAWEYDEVECPHCGYVESNGGDYVPGGSIEAARQSGSRYSGCQWKCPKCGWHGTAL